MKKTISLLLITAIAIGMVGCGKSKESSIQVVDFWSAPNQAQYEYWTKQAENFNASNPEVDGKKIQVKVQQMPESPSSEAGIQNAIATGTVPAISENVNAGFAAILAESDAIYDLKDEDWYQTIVKNRVMETSVQGWEIDGKQYVIPLYINPMAFQWNMKALKALGFQKAPETMDEFKAVITAFVENKDGSMKELGVTHTFYRPALQRADQWWERWYDFQMIYQSLNKGGNWVEGDTLVLNEESVKKTFEFIGMLGNTVMTGEITPLWTNDEVPVLFSINAPWEVNQYAEVGKVYGEDYTYGPTIVENEGDTAYSYADSKGIVLYKHSSISETEHKGAISFISWVYSAETSAENDLQWLNATNMMPVRGDLGTNAVFADKFNEMPALKGLADYIPNALPCMTHAKMTEIQTALAEAGLAPYMNEAIRTEPLNAPDAAPYARAAMEAMKAAGNLN